MTAWDLGVLARAAEADVRGGGLPVRVQAVGTDSRSLPPASLFVALRGERFDGHEFVEAAVRAGALAVLVDERGDAALASLGVPRLVVRDTLTALGSLARHARAERGCPAVAVTGSNGKTTTKELLAAALGARGPVHKTTGNLNNLIGLPLTLFAWPQEAWAAVLEMGMSAPGEIARLVEIAAPQVGVITNVGPAHLLGLGSVEGVARAKGELFAGLPPDAVAIVNADDPLIERICLPLAGARRLARFGSQPGVSAQLLGQQARPGGMRVELALAGERVTVALPLVGPHNAMNAAAAAAAALALGLSPREIATGMCQVTIPGGRLRLATTLASGVHLIDDTYNANPASMCAAFATLASVATGRRVAVLGDMLELGPDAPALHEEVGYAAGTAGIARVLAFGEHAARLAAGARRGGATAQEYRILEELLAELDACLAPGDWILVKGSRGMRMERVVAHLTQEKR